ncbi:unnamed protein product [Rotaria socialis]|uniref:Uncharacterized protein n=3 Tax=Rotaria socialis TaxID=392032 RepID=A0A817SY78_9BILA|nr:unnamed protein product [Rotaria socialis]
MFIDATQAELINRQIMCNPHWASVILKEGGKVCQRCYESLSNVLDDSFDLEAMDIAFEDEMEKIDSPYREESIFAKQSAKEELNASSIQEDPRTNRHLKHLYDVLEQNDDNEVHDLNPDSIRIDESNEFLHGMKELFKQSTYEEQVRLMMIAPESWGRTALSQWFGARDHQARQSILLRLDKGVLAFPEYTRGNKFLDDDTIQSVVQFYLQDDVSRASSNTKDVLKIKNQLVPVRFMAMPIREGLRKFYSDHPTARVGKSCFYSLKPRQVKISCPHETCMCQTHENMSLLLQDTSDEDDKCSRSVWKPIDKKVDLHQIRGTITSLFYEIDENCHVSYAVIQIDFAENYAFLRQREVQAAHWNNQQATLFTIHMKIGSEHNNMVIISDYMRHDTAFVHGAQRLIVDFLRKHYPQVKKIKYLSDGAPAHFKNHFNMINLQHHQYDFNMSASWAFSASGHGEGPCDGTGAAVKSSANRAVLLGDTLISSIEDFLNFTKKSNEDAANLS